MFGTEASLASLVHNGGPHRAAVFFNESPMVSVKRIAYPPFVRMMFLKITEGLISYREARRQLVVVSHA